MCACLADRGGIVLLVACLRLYDEMDWISPHQRTAVTAVEVIVQLDSRRSRRPMTN
jgi:hypothetical protein